MIWTIQPLQSELVADYAATYLELAIATYAPLVGPEYARARRADVPTYAAEVGAQVAIARAGGTPFRHHWVALNERGGILGLASSGRGIGEWEHWVCGDRFVEPATDVTLDHLYLVPGVQGMGLASELLDAALPDRAAAYLWVMIDNRRAVRFYERHGFAADGLEASSGPEWGSMPMQRMVRA